MCLVKVRNKVYVRGVCFIFFKATDSSQSSCTQTMSANVKVKAQGSGGDLRAEFVCSLPEATFFIRTEAKCPKKIMLLEKAFR